MEERIKELEEQNKELTTTNDVLRQSLEECDRIISVNRNRMSEYRHTIKKYMYDNTALKEQLAELVAQNKELKAKYERMKCNFNTVSSLLERAEEHNRWLLKRNLWQRIWNHFV